MGAMDTTLKTNPKTSNSGGLTRAQIGRLIRRRESGYVKIPAPPYEACPHCDAMNTDRKTIVWRISDYRGAGSECDNCSTYWTRGGS